MSKKKVVAYSDEAKLMDSVIEEGNEPIIKIRDVVIGFKNHNKLRIVIPKLNLNIQKGEVFGLVGESGSGKTTIGRAIIRVVPTYSGTITYDGHVISGKISKEEQRFVKKNIQMIFQDPSASLNDRSNIDYIVSEGLRAFHLYKNEEERLEKISNIMMAVGLRPEHLTRYPHEFSGGQRQRVGIARAVVMDPKVIIADEPISALDVSIRAQVLNLIRKFQIEKNMTVLFIAHDLSVVKYISDRIAVIYLGEIVEIATSKRLFEAPLHPYTRALLTAIPMPDPRIERNKEILVYNRSYHDYSVDKPTFVEIEKGHFVRGNSKEIAEYKEILKNLKERA